MVVISIASNKIFTKRSFLISLIFSGILSANTINAYKSNAGTLENVDIPEVVSYKSASCVCCKKWMSHLRDNRVKVVDNIVADVSEIKNQHQIPNNLRSFHYAKIDNYAIEVNVPNELINKLFREKPSIKFIALPSIPLRSPDMPLGSPSMKMHPHNSHSYYYERFKEVSFSKTSKTKLFGKISPK